jgi:hypothetical protein
MHPPFDTTGGNETDETRLWTRREALLRCATLGCLRLVAPVLGLPDAVAAFVYTAVMAKESHSSPNVPLTKQAAGAVTGAVAGSIVAGPAGAIVGGVAGAVMGNRVGQGKPAVPTKAVAGATSVAKQVSRIPVGKAVRALTAKAGVLKKTTKKTAAKKTSARKTNAKKAAPRTASRKSVSRLAARSRSKKSVRR